MSNNESLQLHYKEFGEGHPVIILHGLLGSLDNWQAIAKALATSFHVYIIDQRNHGRSPHSDLFNYEVLAEDLLHFLQLHNIQKAHIIGHSMGGKVAMQFAGLHPEMVAKLVVVDIGPGGLEDRHSTIFQSLLNAPLLTATIRDEVYQYLKHNIDEETTVQFLMKSLVRNDEGVGFSWRFNAKGLWDNYRNIAAAVDTDIRFNRQVLFIKGEQSDYINAQEYASIAAMFPNNEVEEIKGAGHWVHADKPEDFIRAVTNFLKP